MRQRGPDPMESIIAAALDAAGVRYSREGETGHPLPLDFYLPDDEIFIEAKRLHSPRIATQMASAENIIAIQGLKAAQTFARLIARPAEARH